MRFYPYYEGRDAGRTPMQWSDRPGGGFTEADRPWLPLGDVAAANVAAQRDDPGSVLTLCRDLIAFRRRHPEFSAGDTTSLATPETAWAWTRGQRHVVVLNMSSEELVLPDLPGTIQLCTDRSREQEVVEGTLRLAPFEGLILERPSRVAPASTPQRRNRTAWNVSSTRSPSSPAAEEASAGPRRVPWPARAPSVLVVDIDQAAAERVTEGIVGAGGQADAFQADLSDEDQVVATIGAATSRFGRLDVLHNNAALTDSDFLTRDTAVTELALDVWDRTLEVNLRSQMLTCKHAVPEMVRGGGGSIINMSSGASLKGDRTRTAYGVSKAGVNALTMYVATSHGKQGIRVNTILPGLIITDAVRAHLDEKMLAGLGKATLTPNVGQPEDIADVVVFLASDESRYITGQMIAVDGGMSAHVGLGDG